MALDTDRPAAVSFDSFSTLVDIASSQRALEGHTDQPHEVARTWRQRALTYSLLAGPLDTYETYFELHRLGLEYAAMQYDLDLSDQEIREINEVYYDLDPFDDVRETFERLQEAGFELYIISNGNPAMLTGLLESAGIDDMLEETVSAEEIHTFKPGPAIYRHAADRAETPVERFVHVAAPIFDVQGARNAGMQGVWLNRAGEPRDPYAEQPDAVIRSLQELPAALGVE